jgi:acid phosphatase (class A)
VNQPKNFYGRKRPFLIDEGPICDTRTAALEASPDYPSGHTTWGWTVGLVLAELAPDRASDILVRARAYGESRIVCGVHNLSAVDAGRTNASIVVAALHGSPEFRADLEAARREVAEARKAGPAPEAAACKVEQQLTEKSPY